MDSRFISHTFLSLLHNIFIKTDNTTTNTLSDDEQIAMKLFYFIKHAEWESIEKHISDHPGSMFTKITVENKTFSPLQFALEIGDIYTIQYFYKNTLNENDTGFKEQLIELKNQLDEVQSAIQIESLYHAYEKFKKCYRKWEQSFREEKNKIPSFGKYDFLSHDEQEKTSTILQHAMLEADGELYLAVIDLGMAQRQFLPAHFLKEFCRMNTRWDIYSTFDCPYPPRQEDLRYIYLFEHDNSHNDKHNILSFPLPHDMGLGYEYALIRCLDKNKGVKNIEHAQFALKQFGNDIATFIHLYKTRINQIEHLKHIISKQHLIYIRMRSIGPDAFQSVYDKLKANPPIHDHRPLQNLDLEELITSYGIKEDFYKNNITTIQANRLLTGLISQHKPAQNYGSKLVSNEFINAVILEAKKHFVSGHHHLEEVKANKKILFPFREHFVLDATRIPYTNFIASQGIHYEAQLTDFINMTAFHPNPTDHIIALGHSLTYGRYIDSEDFYDYCLKERTLDSAPYQLTINRTKGEVIQALSKPQTILRSAIAHSILTIKHVDQSISKQLSVTLFNLYDGQALRLACNSNDDEVKETMWQLYQLSLEKSVLVHCHQGWGRTGQFILTMQILKNFENIFTDNNISPSAIKIHDLLANMRNARPGLVLTEDQFVFAIHNAHVVHLYAIEKQYIQTQSFCMASDPVIETYLPGMR